MKLFKTEKTHDRLKIYLLFGLIKMSFRHNYFLDNNQVFVKDGDKEKELAYKDKLKNIHFNIMGENNIIKIGKNLDNAFLEITIYGDNNTIIFGDNIYVSRASIIIGNNGYKTYNTNLEINDNVGILESSFILRENHSKIIIGKTCLISSEVKFWCTDSHSVINKDGKLLNIGESIEIGDHVWIGNGCRIGKNTKIPSRSIVGWGSVVTKKFDEKNVIIAGNPATIVKRNIDWDNESPQKYKDEMMEKNKQ